MSVFKKIPPNHVTFLFFSWRLLSSHSLNLFNKYLLHTYHSKHCPTSWGFSGEQNRQHQHLQWSFHLLGGDG